MIGFVAVIGAYATTGQIIQAYSNGHKTSLLEVRRTSQWSSCDVWSSNRHNQLRSIRMDGGFILTNEIQFTIHNSKKVQTNDSRSRKI